MSAAIKIDLKSTDSINKNKLQMRDIASVNTEVLKLVASHEYSKAIQELKKFYDNEFTYPNFKLKVERYITYSIDLILAIETNKNFGTMTGSLTRSKQQELKDKFKKHQHDLKQTLSKIELAYNSLHAADNQSTRLVVKSFWTAIIIVASGALIFEIFSSLGSTVITLLDSGIDYFNELVSKLF